MKTYLLNIISVLTAFCISSGVICAHAPEEAVAAFVHSPSVDSAKVAVMVRDLGSGNVVASYNEDVPLVPASIQKAVTTATLLRTAGKDWAYHTKAYVDGDVERGVLEGNVVVVGSGDPTLNSSKLPLTPDFVADVASALRTKGIDSSAGKIRVDGSVFKGPAVPPSWASGDLRHAYGTGCHGFNFQNNASGKSSVSDPAAVFVSKLKAALAGMGIRIGGNGLDSGRRRLVFDHRSAPLDEIMRSCMMRSDNLYAEALMRTIPLSVGKESTPEKAAEIEYDFWKRKRADTDGVKIVDGSGLSRSNRTTASFMADVLEEMGGDAYYASFFPLAGREGTLKRFLCGTHLEEYVALKTGSMSGIQCYAGYKLDDDYVPTHSIVIIINGMKGGRGAVRSEVEKMLLSIFPEP